MTETKSRQVWIDVAKATAIFLVVLYHVLTGLTATFPDAPSSILKLWSASGKALVPIRMPLFFCVSGILAASALSRPWKQLWRPKIVNLLWPFLLWSLIFSLLGGFRYRPGDPWGYSQESLEAIPYGGNAYWFLSVLIIFFIIVRVFRNYVPALTLVAAGLLAFAPLARNVAIESLGFAAPLAINAQRISFFAFWYFLGVLVSKWARENYRGTSGSLLIALLIAYGGIAGSLYFLGLGSSISEAIYLVMAAVGLLSFSALSYYLARFGGLSRVAVYVSKRTLPIYVIHPIALIPLIILGRKLSNNPDLMGQIPLALQAILPIVIALLLTLFSLGVYETLLKLRMRWMFVLPGIKSKSTGHDSAENSRRMLSVKSVA